MGVRVIYGGSSYRDLTVYRYTVIFVLRKYYEQCYLESFLIILAGQPLATLISASSIFLSSISLNVKPSFKTHVPLFISSMVRQFGRKSLFIVLIFMYNVNRK